MAIKKNVLITGGSSGIGRALVEAFAKENYNVCFTYWNGKCRAEKIIKELPKASLTAIELDQAQPESINTLLRKLPRKIDILINNAALGTKTVEKAAMEKHLQDETFFKVNALGPMWLTMKLLPAMKASGSGKILFIGSVDGGITHFPGARYSDGMSKAALTHFAKHLAAELVDDPIDVYAICPGATNTPMFAASTLKSLSKSEKEALFKSLPGKRLVDPNEIAALALFLCSSYGAILRGTVIDASLGLGNNPFAIHAKRKKR